MFTWLNSQAVRSDSGFEVESMGRFSIYYREGGQVIDVYVENGFDAGKPCVIIEPNAFQRWDGDSPHDILSIERQRELLKNFTDAMQFQGITVIVPGD